MEEGDLTSLIEGLTSGGTIHHHQPQPSQSQTSTANVLLTATSSAATHQQNHFAFIGADAAFSAPAPALSPSIILRSPARSPARPATPVASGAQLVQLLPAPGGAVAQARIQAQAAANAAVVNAQLKGKQPQQILPKPQLCTTSPGATQTANNVPVQAHQQKQTVTRIISNQAPTSTAAPQILINPQPHPTTHNPTLLLGSTQSLAFSHIKSRIRELLNTAVNTPNPTTQMLATTGGGSVLVQPTSASASASASTGGSNVGGTVHLMLRPPPTLTTSAPQGKVVFGHHQHHHTSTSNVNTNQQHHGIHHAAAAAAAAVQQQAAAVAAAATTTTQTLFIQQNRHQVMRIMTAQGPMQVQLQQIQTPTGPQLIAVPAQTAFPQNVLLQSAPTATTAAASATLQLQTPTIQFHAAPAPLQPATTIVHHHHPEPKPIAAKKPAPSNAKKSKSKNTSTLLGKTNEVAIVNNVATVKPNQSNVLAKSGSNNLTSSLRQMRPAGVGNKKRNTVDAAAECTEDKRIDNLTATINSVAINIKSPTHHADDLSGVNEALAAGKAVTLNKRPNLTIVQKVRPDQDQTQPVVIATSVQTQNSITDNWDDFQKGSKGGKKAVSSKKKGKKDESKVDLLDLMKSAGIGDEEFEDGTDEVAYQTQENLEISATDSDILAQLQASAQVSGNLRLAVGEDGRTVLIDGSNVLIPEFDSQTNLGNNSEHPPEIIDSSGNLVNFSPQALATAQNQLTQLLQEHGTVTAADQQLLTQIFTVNPNQGLGRSLNNPLPATSTTTAVSSEPMMTLINSSSSTSSSNVVVTNNTSNSSSNGISTNNESHQQPRKVDASTEYNAAPPQTSQSTSNQLPPGMPPLGPDSLVITNNNGVPTLVASPALMQYLQTHQGIIQFQTDPVTKTIQPSLIIPHPPPQQIPAQQPPPQPDKSPPKKATTDSSSQSPPSLTNILRFNQSVPSPVKMTMVKLMQENPVLLQVARDTNGLINLKESCPTLSEAELVEIDKKIQANRNLLDQCLIQEVEKSSSNSGVLKEAFFNINKENLRQLVKDQQGIIYQVAATQTLAELDAALGKSNNSSLDYQNKYLESIGMATASKPVIGTTATGTSTVVVQSQTSPSAVKKGKKKKEKSVSEQVQVQQQQQQQVLPQILITGPANVPLTGLNVKFNIAQLSPEQNERLNQALNARGVTANQVAQGELTEQTRQIIHEEILKMFPSVTSAPKPPPTSPLPPTTVLTNQILDNSVSGAAGTQLVGTGAQLVGVGGVGMGMSGVGGGPGAQLVALGTGPGNQVLALSSPPPPGSVILGSNGNVVAFVQHGQSNGARNASIPTLQLSPIKQQHLKTLQTQIQALSSKPNRTAAEQSTLQKLLLEQQKVLATGKIVSPQPQTIQIVAPQQQVSGTASRVFQQQQQQLKPSGGNIAIVDGTKQDGQATLIISTDAISAATSSPATTHYQPLYVSPNSNGKQVTKCEKGTSPIQIQMGTQTMPTTALELRSTLGTKMSTGTMTSPNTGKPQAVVAPAIVIQQQPTQPADSSSMAATNIASGKVSAVAVATRVSNNNVSVSISSNLSTSAVIGGQENSLICASPSPTVSTTTSTTTATTTITTTAATEVVVPRTALIEKQLRTDQSGATQPDTCTPFLSKSDACKRLVRYHVMDDKGLNEHDLQAADDIFDATALHLLDKFRTMKEKYKFLLLMESMREVSTAERIMVDRNFIIEERFELEELREKEKRIKNEVELEDVKFERDSTNLPSAIKTETKQDEIPFKEEEELADSGGRINNKITIKDENYDEEGDEQATEINEEEDDGDRNAVDCNSLQDLKDLKDLQCVLEDSERSSSSSSDFGESVSHHKSGSLNDPADISAQVQSAIDSILNLQHSEEDGIVSTLGDHQNPEGGGKKRKRKSDRDHRGGKKRSKKNEDGSANPANSDFDQNSSDTDPVLDEAIRSILAS